MVKAKLPLYIHHCLKCKRFYPNRSDLIPIPDYRGWTTYLCKYCKRPVSPGARPVGVQEKSTLGVKMKTKIQIHLTDQEAADVLTTAIEGNAIQYWACDYGKITITRNTDGYIVRATFEAAGKDNEKQTYRITLATIKKGINTLMKFETSPALRTSILSNEIDNEAADCIVQAAIFGEILYS